MKTRKTYEEFRLLWVLFAAFLMLGLPGQIWARLSRAQKAQKQPAPESHKVPKSEPPDQTFFLVGAGDVASCKDPEGAQATAKLIEQIPGTVFVAGDLAYAREEARMNLSFVMGRPGADSRIAQDRYQATTSMSTQRHTAILNIGARKPDLREKVSTVSTGAIGT